MCSKGVENDFVTENIVIPKPHKGKFSKVYELHKVIKLQTIDESIFAVPSKIVFTDSYIFILDQTRDKLLVFDKEGKYIKKLGSKGKGPNEYLSITSFSVEEKENVILFYDDYISSIFYYSLDSLSFKKKEKIGFASRTFESYDSQLIFYRSLFPDKWNKDLSFDIITTDYNHPEHIKKKFFPYDYYNGSRGHCEKLLKTTEGLFFYRNYTDTVYNYQDGSFIPQYTINFYNSEIPDVSFYKDRSKLSNIKISRELMKGNYVYSYRFFLSEKHMLISYFSKRKHFSYVRDLSSGKELSISTFKDDLGFCLNNREPDFFVKNLVGFIIYPSIVDAHKEKGVRLNAELQKLNVEDNPYLVLFSLKEL